MTHPAPSLAHWPYPFWIAHRGAGQQAPENTLRAFELGAAQGFEMFECDAKLSADGVVFLLHDDTLDRTTNHAGAAALFDWAHLSTLDAGSWHSNAFAGEPLPTLSAVIDWCKALHRCLNIEIKPNPGQDAETGQAVAALWADLASTWPPTLPSPLLSSFSLLALQAAHMSQPQARYALLLEAWSPPAIKEALAIGCVALICHYPLWSAERVTYVHAQGLRALSYTVNDRSSADALIAMGTDGIITDRMDKLGCVDESSLNSRPHIG